MIVDLPFPAGVFQGYFLMRTLVEHRVALAGEHHVDSDRRTKILDPIIFFDGSKKYNLIANMDGLTEVGLPAARDYWRKSAECAPIFLSINHEANDFRVVDLIRSSASVSSFSRAPLLASPGLRRGTGGIQNTSDAQAGARSISALQAAKASKQSDLAESYFLENRRSNPYKLSKETSRNFRPAVAGHRHGISCRTHLC